MEAGVERLRPVARPRRSPSSAWQFEATHHPAGTGGQVVANLLDMTLPQRFQLTFEDHIAIEWKFNRMTKREFLKHMREAWRKAGNPVRRGTRLPNLAFIKHAAIAIKQSLSLMENRQSSGRPMRERDIAAELSSSSFQHRLRLGR
jgi:hypothetical protein